MSRPLSKDYEEVLAVVNKYVESCRYCDAEIGKPAFHEHAVMNGYYNEKDQLYTNIDTLWDMMEPLDSAEKTYTAHTDVLDISGNIAVVRITMEGWHGQSYVDYHELIKTNGEWKIIAKIFCLLEE